MEDIRTIRLRNFISSPMPQKNDLKSNNLGSIIAFGVLSRHYRLHRSGNSVNKDWLGAQFVLANGYLHRNAFPPARHLAFDSICFCHDLSMTHAIVPCNIHIKTNILAMVYSDNLASLVPNINSRVVFSPYYSSIEVLQRNWLWCNW